MIDLYLNQTATWQQRVGDNQYGEPITQSSSIKVRWMDTTQQVQETRLRMHHRQELDSNAVVLTLADVQPGDLLEYNGKSWNVSNVTVATDMLGNTLYKVVHL